MSSAIIQSSKPTKVSKLKAFSASELAEQRFPERRWIVEGLLKQRETVLIHAPTGLGKTWYVWSLAVAAAAGASFAKGMYSSPQVSRVLIVDGEMDTEDLQERLKVVCEVCGTSEADIGENLRVIPRQSQKPGADFLDLDKDEWQKDMLKEIRNGGYDLVVFDNLSTLAKVEDENAASSFDWLCDFTASLKQLGAASIFVHHSRKNASGDLAEAYRGSGKIGVTFNAIIGLGKPEATVKADGAQFAVDFGKFRGQHTALQTKHILTLRDGIWEQTEDESAVLRQTVDALKSLNYSSQKAIAFALKVNESTVSRHLKKAEMLGMLDGRSKRDYFADAKELLKDADGGPEEGNGAATDDDFDF